MNTIIERITEAIKEILIGMIQNGLEGMFVEVNDKVGTIASQVGQTMRWMGNTGVFNLIQNPSQDGDRAHRRVWIITFVLCWRADHDGHTEENNFPMSSKLCATFFSDLGGICGDFYLCDEHI
ncbi:MAG: hypothetical protein ACLR0U_15755 [Enterocloster clostridioformis]